MARCRQAVACSRAAETELELKSVARLAGTAKRAAGHSPREEDQQAATSLDLLQCPPGECVTAVGHPEHKARARHRSSPGDAVAARGAVPGTGLPRESPNHPIGRVSLLHPHSQSYPEVAHHADPGEQMALPLD